MVASYRVTFQSLLGASLVRLVARRFNRRRDLALATGAIAVAIASTILVFKVPPLQQTGLGYIGLFVATLLGSATIFIPAPNIPAIAAHAAQLDPALVALVGGVGWGLGEITGYLAGRGGQLEICDMPAWLIRHWDRYRFSIVTVLAIVPNPVFDVIGVLAGSTRMPARLFLVASILGRVIAAAIICVSTLGAKHFLS